MDDFGKQPLRGARGSVAAIADARKTGMSTDEIMALLRGYDTDARDPGFRASKIIMDA